MTAALALAAIGLMVAGRRPRARRPELPRLGDRLTTRAAAGGLGLAVALVIGGVLGAAAGLGVVATVDRLIRRLEPAGVRRRKLDRAAELPLTLDLVSVCLRAGMPLVAALETVAAALPGPFSTEQPADWRERLG